MLGAHVGGCDTMIVVVIVVAKRGSRGKGGGENKCGASVART